MSNPPPPRSPVAADDPYYITASSLAADLPKLVLKHDDAFFVADHRGDFPDLPGSEFGFYVDDTRFLQRLELRVLDRRPLVLNAAVSDDNLQVAVQLTNSDSHIEGRPVLGRTIRIDRRLTLAGRQLCEQVGVETFADDPHDVELSWHLDGDFVDVFEVRGLSRQRRGTRLPTTREGATIRYAYRGLDDVVRTTHVTFDPPPDTIGDGVARYRLAVPAGQRREITITVSAAEDGAPQPAAPGLRALIRRRREEADRRVGRVARVRASNPRFNDWLDRAHGDLDMLLTETPDGSIPYAGIPWYVTPFGRDSLLTALQVLPFAPDVARGTLRFLARYQGRVDDAFTEEEPGRILHEYRRGEMARCREVAFVPYYGSVDATPLFLMLLAEYVRWTGDVAYARGLWPAAERALAWMAAAPRAPYLTYRRRSPLGLTNQGWKDSQDAIMHDSGKMARPPTAVVEAQGYQYAALLGAADVADGIGEAGPAHALRERAAALRGRFEEDFWQDDLGFYALALDGAGAPCRVISSNPGHCLWAGIVSEPRAAAVTRRLMADDVFSGWGLRTLGVGERLYNPMSYHNGSVWPHDTAIAAAGLRRYGHREECLRLASALFDAAKRWDLLRMPELFCGFPRVPDFGPIRYPVACSPQAWASGVPFQLLATMLGLVPDAAGDRLSFIDPVLPDWLDWVEIRGLRLRDSRLDVKIAHGDGPDASVTLLERVGSAELTVRR